MRYGYWNVCICVCVCDVNWLWLPSLREDIKRNFELIGTAPKVVASNKVALNKASSLSSPGSPTAQSTQFDRPNPIVKHSIQTTTTTTTSPSIVSSANESATTLATTPLPPLRQKAVIIKEKVPPPVPPRGSPRSGGGHHSRHHHHSHGSAKSSKDSLKDAGAWNRNHFTLFFSKRDYVWRCLI